MLKGTLKSFNTLKVIGDIILLQTGTFQLIFGGLDHINIPS